MRDHASLLLAVGGRRSQRQVHAHKSVVGEHIRHLHLENVQISGLCLVYGRNCPPKSGRQSIQGQQASRSIHEDWNGGVALVEYCPAHDYSCEQTYEGLLHGRTHSVSTRVGPGRVPASGEH